MTSAMMIQCVVFICFLILVIGFVVIMLSISPASKAVGVVHTKQGTCEGKGFAESDEYGVMNFSGGGYPESAEEQYESGECYE